MGERVERSEAARLDELAAATRSYGRYFGSSGFAFTATGLWLLASEWALRAAPPTGQLLFAAAPLVWIALASSARLYYQRHGEVVAEGERPGYPARPLFLAVVFVTALCGIMARLGGARGGNELFVVAGFLLVPMLAIRFVRSTPHLTLVFVLTTWAFQAQLSTPQLGWIAWFRPAFAALLVVLGGLDHWHYRRVERRLAALKDFE